MSAAMSSGRDNGGETKSKIARGLVNETKGLWRNRGR